MFDMINIFEVFLPQLLRYPNPTDPLNGEAAAMMLREPKNYEIKVKGMYTHEKVIWALETVEVDISLADYVQKYASKEAADEADAESEDDGELSSVASFDDEDDDEAAGKMDDV